MSKKSYQVIISGIVQGVAFRFSAVRKAKQLGVNGWIKNRIDGKVETRVEGEENTVNLMVSWLKKGPIQSKVADIDVNELNYKGEFNSFEIR